MADELYVPLGELIASEVWPTDVLGSANFDFLNGIAYSGGSIFDDEFGTNIELDLDVVAETVFDLPFGFAIVFGAGPIRFMMGGDDQGFEAWLKADIVKLRLPRDLFVPVIDGDDGKPIADPDPAHFTEITFDLGMQFDSDGNIDLAFPAEDTRTPLELPRCMLGNTGVIISANDVIVRLSEGQTLPDAAYAKGLDPSWRGLYMGEASVTLAGGLGDVFPANSQLKFENCFIGTGGFTGKLTLPFPGAPTTSLFGADFTIQTLTLEIEQNALTMFEIRGALQLDFFDDPLDVIVSVDLDGTILIRLTNEGGLVSVGVQDVFTFTIDKIEFEVQDDGDLFARTSGTLTPTFQPGPGQIDWPGFRLENLEIDSDGNVRIAGGWIDLPEQASLNLFGFIIEITRLGFGKTEEGRNWIGFNGAVRILDGIPAGASVEGVRIIWGGPVPNDPTKLTLEGVGVDVTIPGVVRFAGKVSLTGPEFRGAVLVEIPSISFQIEGQFVAGTIPNTTIKTYGLFLQTQLPAGIPLGPSGLAFYGLAGLYAHNREPNKGPNEGWYRSPDMKDTGWFTRDPVGVTDLGQKWQPTVGKMGLGAGIIIGTLADNGYMFNGRLLLVLVFPGPVILLEGMANLFKRRTALGSGDEPNFHALVVIEPGKDILAALDAQYRFADGGELMEIRGSAEAFFSFQNARDWHINLGVDSPFERRIGARIFQLFDVGGFFMLNADRLFVGAGWRYHKRYGWKHLNVTLKASMGGDAFVSWHPAHFAGSVFVEGSAELRAFSISMGISVGARVKGDVFDPFGLRGEFKARLNLPWPLPDIKKTIVVAWRHEFSPEDAPPLPVPLREAAIVHRRSENTWALQRDKSLRAEHGGFEFERPGNIGPTPAPGNIDPPFAPEVGIPRVPADSKVALTFTRPMRVPFLLAANEQDIDAEVIGDPRDGKDKTYSAGYNLVSVELQKWAPVGESNTDGGLGWVPIQRAGEGAESLPGLVASWGLGVEIPAEGYSERNKLFINALTPFDYTSGRSKAWEDWFLGQYPNFACPLPLRSQSAHFTQPIGTQLDVLSLHTFEFDVPAFEIQAQYGGDITANDEVVAGLLGPLDRGVRYRMSVRTLEEQVATRQNWVLPPTGATKAGILVGIPPEFSQATVFGSYGRFDGSPATPNQFGHLVTINRFRISEDVRIDLDPPEVGSFLDHSGMELTNSVELIPDVPVLLVEMMLFGATLSDGAPGEPLARIELFDSADNPLLATPHEVGPGQTRLRFKFPDIARVVVTRSRQDWLMEQIIFRAPITAVITAASDPTAIIGTVVEQQGLMQVESADLGKVYLFEPFGCEFVLIEMTVPGREGEIIRHNIDSLVRLTEDDPLFEPENDYRLVVSSRREDKALKAAFAGVLDNTTDFIDHAYFHVVGPPGVETPEQPPPPNPESVGAPGLGDLRLYVEQTLPPTIPAQGDKLLLPRAFYRGCDVAVKFHPDVNYAELFYLRARRSLTVRLYDVDDNPVLAADGRVAIPFPSWERSRSQEIRESVSRWISSVEQSICFPEDAEPVGDSTVSKPQTLSGVGQDVILAPETLHQVRLVPALVHETFVDPLPGLIANGGSHRLERWKAENTGGAPSRWQINVEDLGDDGKIFFVEETTGNPSTLYYDGPLGAVVGHDSPSQWSNFRASVVLRWAAGLVAFDFRRSSSTNFLRVTLDRNTGQRRLFLFAGASSLIREDSTTFPNAGTDVILTVECVDDRVQVFQDAEPTPIFDVSGMPTAPGTVGLHVEGATACRFTEIRVDDLRPTPSTAFAFDFVSSKYTNFHHHVHSFSDTASDGAPGEALTTADLSAQLSKSIIVPSASSDGLGEVTDAERRAFDALEAKAFGPAALAVPQALEITRVSEAGAPLALMVRSPEPFLWERTLLEATSAAAAAMDIPGDLKITEVTFGAAATGESVTILVRAKTSLAHHRLEWRPLPDAGNPDPEWTTYLAFDANEPELDDGFQVRVLAASETDPEVMQHEPGSIRRFVTPADEVHFTAPGVELRLLDPDGETVAHQRRFPTSDAFTAFPMRAVRKLDGTAFILFVEGAGAAPAALRLRWTFNRAVGDEDLRFRQGGSETGEVATLDFVVPPGT